MQKESGCKRAQNGGIMIGEREMGGERKNFISTQLWPLKLFSRSCAYALLLLHPATVAKS